MQCKTTLQLAVRCAACMGVLAITSAAARAQSFNIDIGPDATKPSKAYGAACGQAGRWMNIPAGLPLTQIPMTDTNGNTTRATALYTPAVALTFDDPQTKGDDEALLDDAQRLATAGVWKIAGLTPGNYDVFTYAWAPDDPLNNLTRVTVRGSSDAPQEVGGQIWTGSFVQGGQYARHRVALVAGGVLQIELDVVSNTAGTINGIQLVHDALGTSSSYCTSGMSSGGCLPSIHGSGTRSVLAPAGFTIQCQNVPGERFGAIGVDWNTYMTLSPFALVDPRYLGQTVDAQGWYRDPAAPKTTQPTHGLHFVLGL